MSCGCERDGWEEPNGQRTEGADVASEARQTRVCRHCSESGNEGGVADERQPICKAICLLAEAQHTSCRQV